MIDWFRGQIPFVHHFIPAGMVVSLQPNGEVEWQCEKKLKLRSSWDTSVIIKSAGACCMANGQQDYNADVINHTHMSALNIDGNIAKFIQGHNVFGTRDINRLVYLGFEKITQILSEHFQGHDLQIAKTKRLINEGEYLLKMVDINQFYDCGNDASVESWLHASEMRAKTRHGRATSSKGTIYLGQHSKRWAIKFYNKAREILKHKLPNELQGLGMETFLQGLLRVELRLFAGEMLERHGITHGKHLTENRIDQLFNDYLARIEMSQQVTLIDEQLMALPVKLYGTYQLWRQGAYLRELLPHNTFYRHRRLLLEHGIDILMPNPLPEESNVIPLLRIIEAKPIATPHWAYEKKLIAC